MEISDFSIPLGIRKLLDNRERSSLSPFASYSDGASRRQAETQLETDYRLPFSMDVDRILHSRAYTRYIDKTQVFYLIENRSYHPSGGFMFNWFQKLREPLDGSCA